MKKRMYLLLLMIVLASMDVICIDYLHASVPIASDDPQSNTSEEQGHTAQERSKVKNTSDGVPPEAIASVIRQELVLFPIPESGLHPDYQVAFEDSWMSERTFGGARGHEGTDIMLDPDERGLFPVLSMTDGTIEKKGWLPQGGYRLGIRSSGGIYYYYAHLNDYAQELETGSVVIAGQLLGFAGDSGYSNIEGTVGNFPVHLHVGIYYNDDTGTETAINPYPFLIKLKKVCVSF